MRLLGVVENMSGDVFGSGGGEALSLELGVPFLGTVPLDGAMRASGDEGEPVVWADPEAPAARALRDLAESLTAPRAGGFVKSLPLVS
jgi:ATP-binding protein involved in chromosome partitioning